MSRTLINYAGTGTGTEGVEWLDYGLECRGAGQFDEMTGVLEGFWRSPAAARAAMIGKKLTPPGAGVSGAYGFYVRDGSLSARWVKGGRIRVELSAPGLIERKVRAVALAVPEQYALTNVTVGSNGPAGLPAGTYDRLQFRAVKRGYDITVAWAPTALAALDLAGAGKRITGHWTAQAAEVSLAEPPNPFTGGTDITAHYPSGWFYEVQPGDSVGGGALLVATFALRHQWFLTL